MPRLKDKFFKAQELRKRGFSLKEISDSLKISKSTASLWSRDIQLSKKAAKRLSAKVTHGQLISARQRIARTDAIRQEYFEKGIETVRTVARERRDKMISKIFCALLYWCEGGKHDDRCIQFTNSDPKLIRVFVNLFRKSFPVDESKFRILLHLHEYHSLPTQIKFWQAITSIPASQFSKPYLKPHSGKRMKLDYPGCVNIRYYDANIARELLGVGKAFLEIFGGVV